MNLDHERNPRAFRELVRIVSTETPKSLLDLLRFAQMRALILTGIRASECSLLPADWKRRGAPQSLILRHFAEKGVVYKNSSVLLEMTRSVPVASQRPLADALDRARAATEPLRITLKAQIKSGRILPQSGPKDLVKAGELYTHLTGNPFVVKTGKEVRRAWGKKYQDSFDPTIFDQLRTQQMEDLSKGRDLETSVYSYFRRHKEITFRTALGFEARPFDEGRMNWSDLHLRIDEVEAALKIQGAKTLSDTSPLKTSRGELPVSALLFLMPKLGPSHAREDGLYDITRYCSIGRMDSAMTTDYLSSGRGHTFFSVYGKTDSDRKLALTPPEPQVTC